MNDKKADVRSFKTGDILFKEGDPGGELWIIKKGDVEIFRERSGRSFSLGTLTKGELLGTMTALNGAPRSASVRAKSDVEVSVVGVEQMQKLLGSVPSWANSFIKDLVARVHYANDLHIESELAAQNGLSGPIDLALRATTMLSGMADLIAIDVGGDMAVPLEVAVDRLSMMLGFKEDLRKILQVLINNGQLLKSGHDLPPRFVTMQSALELRLFSDAIVKAQAVQTTAGVFTLPLAQGQRKMLGELVRLGLARSSGKNETVLFPLKEIEDEFRKNKLGLVDLDGLQRAALLGYLTLDKQSEVPTVTLDPTWLDYGLRALEAMSQILTQVGGQARKRAQVTAAT